MVFFYLIFLLYTTIRPKIRVLIDFFFYFHSTIRPKIRVLINLFILLVHDHFTKNQGRNSFISFILKRPFNKNIYLLSFVFSLCTTIRPKIRVIINLFILFVHDHSAKVRGHSYSLIDFSPNCANIPFGIFKAVFSYISFTLILAVLPLCFVRYLHSSTSYPYTSYTLIMEVLLLYIWYAISMAI